MGAARHLDGVGARGGANLHSPDELSSSKRGLIETHSSSWRHSSKRLRRVVTASLFLPKIFRNRMKPTHSLLSPSCVRTDLAGADGSCRAYCRRAHDLAERPQVPGKTRIHHYPPLTLIPRSTNQATSISLFVLEASPGRPNCEGRRVCSPAWAGSSRVTTYENQTERAGSTSPSGSTNPVDVCT